MIEKAAGIDFVLDWTINRDGSQRFDNNQALRLLLGSARSSKTRLLQARNCAALALPARNRFLLSSVSTASIKQRALER